MLDILSCWNIIIYCLGELAEYAESDIKATKNCIYYKWYQIKVFPVILGSPLGDADQIIIITKCQQFKTTKTKKRPEYHDSTLSVL